MTETIKNRLRLVAALEAPDCRDILRRPSFGDDRDPFVELTSKADLIFLELDQREAESGRARQG